MDPKQQFKSDRPCPVCGGHEGLPQGDGRRCLGATDRLSADSLSCDEHMIRYFPYWESSGSKGNPNEMVAS